ncbi:Putative major facilitator superfamily, MFS transporter superfamily [Septoria linicola]|uniref:Major facilitator superfamily, MFS transporter superfamily n=1 Tax=Septoria linicola TaxID=215465 RepID=A0A9Q9B318_9PEZI|nr:Putative major facilitator superfamily, MFS transporter superfamily [Septoria linicola]
MSRPSSISGSEKQLEDALKPAEDTSAHHQSGRNESRFTDDALEPKTESMRNSEEDKTTTEQSDVEKLDPHAKVDYSIFTTGQKRAIVVAGSLAGWFSPMTGSIYFPALTTIANDLNVTSSKINITVTTYLIIQGLAPMMIAGFSDKAGRRPAYIICFTIYIIANLALGLQNSYVALLILRMLQSAGSSGTIALANGLVGDCITSAERGQYIAWASLGSILGPTLSPIIGGLLVQYLDWHWIFWFLLILSGACFVPLFLFLPETCRNIVGDGSVPPPWSSWNLTDSIRFKHRAKRGIKVDEEKLAELRKNYKLTVPNPMSTLVAMTDLETALILLATGLAMACFYALSTGISDLFSKNYGFDELHVSFMFLPIGGGSIIAAFTTGRMVDWNYRRHAKRLNYPVIKNRDMDLSNFPIELARVQIGLPILVGAALAVIGYGWMMDHKISLAGPIIMLFILGYCLIAGFQVLNVLMLDIYPGQPATATAANNVFRCLLGAAASAAITPMSNAIGNGWAYTILAILVLLSLLGLLASVRYGMGWRRAKKEKAERRKQAKDGQR